MARGGAHDAAGMAGPIDGKIRLGIALTALLSVPVLIEYGLASRWHGELDVIEARHAAEGTPRRAEIEVEPDMCNAITGELWLPSFGFLDGVRARLESVELVRGQGGRGMVAVVRVTLR